MIFITLPKVYEIGKIIGLQYFYLFAADSTEDRTLVNYYNQKLFFRERLNSKRFIRPCYDDGCTFMYMTYADVSALYQQYIKTGK